MLTDQDITNLIKKFNSKIIVLSYRNKGIPSIKELKNIFIENNMKCRVCLIKKHSYALNKANKALAEYLFIAKPQN